MARFFDSKNCTEEHDAPSGYWLTNYQVYTLAPNGAVISQETMNNFQVDNAKLEDVRVSVAPEAVAWRAKNIPLGLYLIEGAIRTYGLQCAVVIAENEEAARRTHPLGAKWDPSVRRWGVASKEEPDRPFYGSQDWLPAPQVVVSFVGTAKLGSVPGVVLYNESGG